VKETVSTRKKLTNKNPCFWSWIRLRSSLWSSRCLAQTAAVRTWGLECIWRFHCLLIRTKFKYRLVAMISFILKERTWNQRIKLQKLQDRHQISNSSKGQAEISRFKVSLQKINISTLKNEWSLRSSPRSVLAWSISLAAVESKIS
jgi:hypothetical protein